MKLKPLAGKVIIEVLKAEEKTKGGIILPDTAKEKPQEAKVIAVGAGKTTKDGKVIEPEVKDGDIILFSKYSGNEVKLGESEYLIIEQDDILAKIT